MTSNRIINQIIEKGGVLGACAQLWRRDRKKATLFIKECAAMCHTPLANRLWGPGLIRSIVRYSDGEDFQSKRINSFDLKIINTIKHQRKKIGIKQDAIANALEMTQSNYSKIEKGQIPLTVGQLIIIYREFNLPISELLSSVLNQKHSTNRDLAKNLN